MLQDETSQVLKQQRQFWQWEWVICPSRPHSLDWTVFYFLLCYLIKSLFLHLGPSTSFCSSNKYGSKPGTPASNPKKPAEVSPHRRPALHCGFVKCNDQRWTDCVPPPRPSPLPKVFRKDLISAMKLPDSHHVSPEDYYLLADTWKQEWEKGVQVPASPDTIPEPSVR